MTSFLFQKIQYFYDAEEKKTFKPISYPTNEQFSYYQNSKGFQVEDEVTIMQRKYGLNKYLKLFLSVATCKGLFKVSRKHLKMICFISGKQSLSFA